MRHAIAGVVFAARGRCYNVLPLFLRVNSRSSTSPLAMSIMSLASWAGSRGRLGRFSGMMRVCRERRPVSRAALFKGAHYRKLARVDSRNRSHDWEGLASVRARMQIELRDEVSLNVIGAGVSF